MNKKQFFRAMKLMGFRRRRDRRKLWRIYLQESALAERI